MCPGLNGVVFHMRVHRVMKLVVLKGKKRRFFSYLSLDIRLGKIKVGSEFQINSTSYCTSPINPLDPTGSHNWWF